MLIKFQDIELNIVQDKQHEFLLSGKEVAIGYGVTDSVIRDHKRLHADELVEGKHFITVENIDANPRAGIPHTYTSWTKRGIIRLGFFIKSVRARIFRDWAEDLIIEITESPSPRQNIQTAVEYAKRKKIIDTRQRVDPQDALIREALYIAHGGKCFYTGVTLERDCFHIDHIQPKNKGGEDALYNLVLCDPTTNRQKGDWIDHSWVVSKQTFNENTHAIIAGRIYNDKIYINSMSSFREQLLSNAAMVQLLCKLLGERVMRRIMSAALGVDDETIYALSSVDSFIKDRVRLNAAAKTRLGDMYAAYSDWCKEAGSVAMFARDFERSLKESKMLSVKRAREQKGDKYTMVIYVVGGEI